MGTKLHKKRKHYKFNPLLGAYEFKIYRKLNRAKRLEFKRQKLFNFLYDGMIALSREARGLEDKIFPTFLPEKAFLTFSSPSTSAPTRSERGVY